MSCQPHVADLRDACFTGPIAAALAANTWIRAVRTAARATARTSPDKRWSLRTTLLVEPSAGAGALIDALSHGSHGPARILALDIAPDSAAVIKADFLSATTTALIDSERAALIDSTRQRYAHVAVLANPPFGVRGNLALPHLNRALAIADFAVMILPRSARHACWQKRVSPAACLIEDQDLPVEPFWRAGRSVSGIACCLQTWSRDSTVFPGLPDLRLRPSVPTAESLGLYTVHRIHAISGRITPPPGAAVILTHAFDCDFSRSSRGLLLRPQAVSSGAQADVWTGSRHALKALRSVNWHRAARHRSTTRSLSLDRCTVLRTVAGVLAKRL